MPFLVLGIFFVPVLGHSLACFMFTRTHSPTPRCEGWGTVSSWNQSQLGSATRGGMSCEHHTLCCSLVISGPQGLLWSCHLQHFSPALRFTQWNNIQDQSAGIHQWSLWPNVPGGRGSHTAALWVLKLWGQLISCLIMLSLNVATTIHNQYSG